MRIWILFTAALLVLLAALHVYANEKPGPEPTQVGGGTVPQLTPMATTMQLFFPWVPQSADGGAPLVLPANAAPSADFGAFDAQHQPLEVQSWWLPAYGHVHAAALVPIGQQVKGVVDLPVRVVMHDNPGKFHRLDLADESGKDLAHLMPGDLTCPSPGVCAWGYTLPVDTSKEKDGWREWRLQAYINTPDGKQMMTSSGIPVLVLNGKTRSDFSHPCSGMQFIARGWYTGILYTNAMIDCIPTGPVAGSKQFRVRAQQPSSHLTVELDKSHTIPAVDGWAAQSESAGALLFDRDGDFQSWQTITVDTTQLANGWHSLAVRATSKATAMTPGFTDPNHNAGVAKVFFYVEN